MKKLFKRIILSVIPLSALHFMHPDKRKSHFNKFIKVYDELSLKPFYLYLREDSFMEQVILQKGLYGEWEKESLKIWAQLSKKAKTILDIGANTGIFSMIAQNNNPTANIIAVEPVDINFNILSKNIRKNKYSIVAEKIALSDKEGIAKMFMLKDRLNYMTSVNDDRYADAPHVKGDHEVVEIEVPIKPFDYLINKYNPGVIDLIKIDVEGHETAVVNAMLPYLELHKPTILIEVIGSVNAESLDAIFKKLGYKYISMDEKNTSRVVKDLWDNDQHNFLICNSDNIDYLIDKKLCIL